MNTSLYMFTLVGTQVKVPFNLDNFSHSVPIAGDGRATGAILYPIGGEPLYVSENIEAVTAITGKWFAAKGALLQNRV